MLPCSLTMCCLGCGNVLPYTEISARQRATAQIMAKSCIRPSIRPAAVYPCLFRNCQLLPSDILPPNSPQVPPTAVVSAGHATQYFSFKVNFVAFTRFAGFSGFQSSTLQVQVQIYSHFASVLILLPVLVFVSVSAATLLTAACAWALSQ